MAIQSFSDRKLEDFFYDGTVPKKRCPWGAIYPSVKEALDALEAAQTVEDLRNPPGNQLETLQPPLEGYWSIRVNRQYRLIFRWTEEGVEDVYIDDYH